MRKIFVCAVFFFTVLAGGWTQEVKTVQDANGGWRLLVDGKPFFVKGVVWSMNPPGTNYNFSLWKESDAVIRSVIDRDAQMMVEMGVNTIRIFSDIPQKWVEYFYSKYGIYTIINDLFGRYGTGVEGRWFAVTNYEDPKIRRAVQKNALAAITKYRNVPGVLMFMFGNENNYGLSWGATANILDIPGMSVDERKARALYSCLEEAIQAAKELDPYHPVGFVNGDLAYIDYIAEECPSLDILGSNVYRGAQAGEAFYREMREKLDKPVLFMEIGCDAWNAKLQREDQYHQAVYIASQWREMYENAYGRGKSNALGGCVFEWTDEWWKTNPDSQARLDIHDTDASWTNWGFFYDMIPGQRNMNEEWFGITAQGERSVGRYPIKHPRAAWYALQYIWTLDPTAPVTGGGGGGSDVATHFDGLNLAEAVARGTADAHEYRQNYKISNNFAVTVIQSGDDVIKKSKDESNPFELFPQNAWGAELRTTLWGVSNQTLMGKLEGEVTLALRHDAIAGEPLSSRIEQTAAMANPDRPVDLYSGWFTWAGFGAEVKGYFHTGHADWEAEGDFFNFLPECYDFDSYDKWGAKLPIAVEGAYHFGLPGAQGLKIIGGPIIYSGASPMVLGKWYQTINAAKSLLSFSALLSQEIASYSTETGTVETPRSKASLWLAWQPEMSGVSSLRADVGILESNWQKLDDTWRVDASGEHTIGFADTLAVKGRVSYSPIQYLSAQAEAVYAGLVAESNGGTARVGTLLTDSGAGNRVEIKGGITGNYDVFQLQLNALWRQPLTGPIEDAALVSLAQTNPFYVGASREALRLEAVLSWDMEPGTWIWAWDGDDTEGALAAASLVANYSVYEGATDPGSYKGNDGKRYWYALGLPRIEGAYSVALRTVFNPLPDLRIVNVAQFVRGQPNGGVFSDERPTVSGFQEALKVRYKQALFSGMVAMDMWGPESFQKDLNLTYPLRWSFELGWSFKARPSLVNNSDRIALRWNGVVRDHFSYNFNARDSEELVLYFNIGF